MTENKVGVANPYALAEIALGKRVRWSAIKDHDRFVEKTLGVSMEKLLQPAQGNFLFSGRAETARMLEEHRLDVKENGGAPRAVAAHVARHTAATFDKLAAHAIARIQSTLFGAPPSDAGEHTPTGAEWADPGDFFEEASEFFDPVQGGLGDCYLISALSAVAWSRPYVIAQRTRATGAASADFVNRIEFFPSAGASPISFEVTEQMPVLTGSHGWIYARSSETGEIWPAVYEKAYAKWKTDNTTDKPDYSPIAGGWPVQACTELTGLRGTTRTCSDLSADDIWQAIRANCRSYRTFNPVVAWTFCTDTPPVNYSGSGLVGYHAYTVLGWAFINNEKYVVIRNPWGHNGPVINGLTGSWQAYDQSFWRSVPLNAGGVFAIPASTFKSYFWQFGWVS